MINFQKSTILLLIPVIYLQDPNVDSANLSFSNPLAVYLPWKEKVVIVSAALTATSDKRGTIYVLSKENV